MKKLLLTITIVLFISGCSALQSARFDSNEYASFVRVNTLTQLAKEKCDDAPGVKMMVFMIKAETLFLNNYTKHLPINAETHQIAEILHRQALELEERYKNDPPSAGYCRAKLDLMSKAAERASEAVGRKVNK